MDSEVENSEGHRKNSTFQQFRDPRSLCFEQFQLAISLEKPSDFWVPLF